MSKPTCPDDCTSMLTDWQFDECSPIWNPGEISTIYLFNIGYPVAASPRNNPAGFIAEMAARVSNTAAAANAIRQLTVIGEKPEPEMVEIKLSGDRTITAYKRHTVIAEIDEFNETNREAMRYLECGNQFLMMYENGSLIYGGSDNIEDGIECSIIATEIIPKDRTDICRIRLTIKWEDKFSPDATTNPLI